MLNWNLYTLANKRGQAFPTAGLTCLLTMATYESEGTTYYVNSKGNDVPVVSGSGLDEILDFSVLNDVRLDKSNATYWGATLDPYFYDDPANPYHYKFTDFSYRQFQDQMASDNNYCFAKLIYKATVLQSVDFLAIYSEHQSGIDLTNILKYIKVLPDYLGSDILNGWDFTTWFTQSSVNTVTANSWYSPTNGDGVKDYFLTVGDKYRHILKGTTETSGIGIYSSDFKVYGETLDKSFDMTNDFVAITDGILMILSKSTAGTTTITENILRKIYTNYYENESEFYEFVDEENINYYYNLSTESTIIASETDKHYGFPALQHIDDRLNCIYRDARSHTAFDGVMKNTYTDDKITWSAANTIYDGTEILTYKPQFLIDDPLAVTDVRDPRTMIIGSNLYIFSFVTIGHNLLPDDTDPSDPENIDVRVSDGFFSVCLKIPIVNDNELDLANKVITYISETDPFSGGYFYKDDVLYTTTYDLSFNVKLHKSTDLGATWSIVSTIFNAGVNGATESALVFVGKVLYCIGRGETAGTGIMARSYNNGLTWTDYTEIPSYSLSGINAVLLPDNKILAFGRRGGPELSFYKIDGLEISGEITDINIGNYATSDIGYGNIEKYNGKYYFPYMNGPLRDYPNLYEQAYCGIFYKTIDKNIIE